MFIKAVKYVVDWGKFHLLLYKVMQTTGIPQLPGKFLLCIYLNHVKLSHIKRQLSPKAKTSYSKAFEYITVMFYRHLADLCFFFGFF